MPMRALLRLGDGFHLEVEEPTHTETIFYPLADLRWAKFVWTGYVTHEGQVPMFALVDVVAAVTPEPRRRM